MLFFCLKIRNKSESFMGMIIDTVTNGIDKNEDKKRSRRKKTKNH